MLEKVTSVKIHLQAIFTDMYDQDFFQKDGSISLSSLNNPVSEK
jgi:hypothetical protein